MPGGRPSKFDMLTELDRKNIERMAKRGFTDKEMAEFLDITEQTFNNWKLDHPKFFESLKEWKEYADARVERSLYERALGFSHAEDKIFKPAGEAPTVVPTIKHYAPDTTACIFWLKNRKKKEWRDKVELDHGQSTDDEGNDRKWRVEVTHVTKAK
jgi:hypothetical protein